MRIRSILGAFLLSSFIATGASAQSNQDRIEILSGHYGRSGSNPRIDITSKLVDLCQGADKRCDVFCDPSGFGSRSLGGKAACRVTWRCPDATVRSLAAASEELMLIRCPEPAGAASPANELPSVPTYTPPEH